MLKQFNCLFLKEFKSYFRTHTAYFIMMIYLVLSMIAAFYSGYFFLMDNTDLISFFSFQPEILAVLIPAVTMRLWADEHKSGTIEFLLTQPVKYSVLVYAKYFAAVAFCLLLLLMTVPFVFYVNQLTNVDNYNVAASYLGCLLVSGTFCAIGCTVSSFSSNAVVAYLISVFLSWVAYSTNFNFILGIISSLSGQNISPNQLSLNLTSNFQTFASGQLGVDSIVYFLSAIILVLWFNIVSVEYKKS